MGLSQLIGEGEEGQQEGVEDGERSTGDRVDIGLPGVQEALLDALQATGKPVVVVLLNGSAVAATWAAAHASALVELWYPGEEGAQRWPMCSLATPTLPGGCRSRSTGRWTICPRSGITGWKGTPIATSAVCRCIRFGFGLSYTTFAYGDLALDKATLAAGKPCRCT